MGKGNNMRGLSEKQIERLKGCHELKELIDDPEIFLGIRDGYCNLYYQCASMGKICFKERPPKLTIETHREYLPETSAYQSGKYNYVVFSSCEKDEEHTIKKFCDLAKKDGVIRTKIDQREGTGNRKKEKNAQHKLVLSSADERAEWFCVDLEYAQAQDKGSEEGRSFGRFDIVAVKKRPDDKGIHSVAMVELKVGNTAYSSEIKDKEVRDNIAEFCIDKYDWSLGSGLLGHMADFYRFETRPVKNKNGEKINRFSQLKEEICSILANREALGILVPDTLKNLEVDRLSGVPEFYFVTLCVNENDMESCKKSLKNYMNSRRRNGEASTYNVMDVFAEKVLDKDENAAIFRNYHFLFYAPWNDNIDLETGINDILKTGKDSLEWSEVFR